MPDDLGRFPITDAMKSRVSAALLMIPDGKRGAILVIADEHGTRGQVAAKLGDGGGWKIAAGAGFVFGESKPYGYVAIAGTW